MIVKAAYALVLAILSVRGNVCEGDMVCGPQWVVKFERGIGAAADRGSVLVTHLTEKKPLLVQSSWFIWLILMRKIKVQTKYECTPVIRLKYNRTNNFLLNFGCYM